MSLKNIQAGTIRKLGCFFLFAFHSNYMDLHASCIISEIKRDICRKSWFFHTFLHSTPPLGGLRHNIAIPFGVDKTKMVELADGEKMRIYVIV